MQLPKGIRRQSRSLSNMYLRIMTEESVSSRSLLKAMESTSTHRQKPSRYPLQLGAMQTIHLIAAKAKPPERKLTRNVRTKTAQKVNGRMILQIKRRKQNLRKRKRSVRASGLDLVEARVALAAFLMTNPRKGQNGARRLCAGTASGVNLTPLSTQMNLQNVFTTIVTRRMT